MEQSLELEGPYSAMNPAARQKTERARKQLAPVKRKTAAKGRESGSRTGRKRRFLGLDNGAINPFKRKSRKVKNPLKAGRTRRLLDPMGRHIPGRAK